MVLKCSVKQHTSIGNKDQGSDVFFNEISGTVQRTAVANARHSE